MAEGSDQDVEQSDGVNFGQGNKARIHDAVGHDQYNRRSGADANVNVNVGREEQRRDNGSRVERALWGDTYTGYPGLIKEVQELKTSFDSFARNSQRTWVTPGVAVFFLALAVAILLLGFYGITVYGR